MKITRYTLASLFSLVLLLCSCGGNEVKDGLTGRVTMDKYEGRQVYLETTVGGLHRIDSTLVKDGKFSFTFNDTLPEVYRLTLYASDKDIFPITLPVVSEKGHVKVVMGELVLTSGTPLNDNLQDFLLAVSNLNDKVSKQEKLDMEQFKVDFAKLIEGAVMQNIKNPVGAYIYRMYGSRLSDEQKAQIMQMADSKFKESIR